MKRYNSENFSSPLSEVKCGLSMYIETQNANIIKFPAFIAVACYEITSYNEINELSLRVSSQRQFTKDVLDNKGLPVVYVVTLKGNKKKEMVMVGSSTIVKAIKMELGILPTPGLVLIKEWTNYQYK